MTKLHILNRRKGRLNLYRSWTLCGRAIGKRFVVRSFPNAVVLQLARMFKCPDCWRKLIERAIRREKKRG